MDDQQQQYVDEEQEIHIDEDWLGEWFDYGLKEMEVYLRKHALFQQRFPEEDE